MTDEAGRRFTAKRALRGVATPFVGYFDRRFQELHDHLDEQVVAALRERFDQMIGELRTTRSDVATDADTIVELAFTLERFADMFTFRMEELAAALRSGPHLADPAVVELPFAYAVAGKLEAGCSVLVLGGGDSAAIGLAALGLQVTALGHRPTDSAHPDVARVDTPVDQWGGADRTLDAIFALSEPPEIAHPTRELVDQFAKWLRPGGFAALAIGLEPPADVEQRVDALLTDWHVERQERFARAPGGLWRRCQPGDRPAIALVEAVARP